LSWGARAFADPVFYISGASTWKYFKGTQEASAPDSAWRANGFADGSWASGAAPFGYGDGPYGTDLSLLVPPMRANYTSLFLRKTFDVTDAALVPELELNVKYDDGFIAWINGNEVLRVNVPGAAGSPVAYNGVAAAEHEAAAFEVFDLPNPATYLSSGTNVLALQVFNLTISSTDLSFDLELYDPLGPDLRPPSLASQAPAPGATVRRLTQIELTFDEPVTGVDATDLRVNGAPAAGVAGLGRGPYIFGFPEPPAGAVSISWAAGHGIKDLAAPPNSFGGVGWNLTLDPNAPVANLVISELLASSARGLKDEDGEASDWIEVHNLGAAVASLAGCTLTDDADDAAKWVFPAVTLPPGQYLVVFASGKDRRPTTGNLHASFKLNSSGEYLALLSGDSPRAKLTEFSPRFPAQRTDFSYGLDQGGVTGYFSAPTPGGPNGQSLAFSGFAADPSFSVPRGSYDAPFSLEITTATPGADIYYTLDGSEPTPTSGTLYQGPLAVAGTQRKAAITFRAAAFEDGYLPSNVITHTFLFQDKVLTQPRDPDGFPPTWGSGLVTPADYEMDPLVAQNPSYIDRARQGLSLIPSVSVVMDIDDLFGRARGIYSNPSSEGVAWERPASVELFFPLDREPAQVDCGIRVQGGSSTSGWKSLKLSLRLFFKDDYGFSKFHFPLYADSRVERFDTLVLDAGLNLTWNHPAHDQRVRSQYVRDQFVSDLQGATGSVAPHGIFVHLYLNGLYWGLYDLHERPDASFAAEFFGGDKSEYDVLRHVGSEVVSGNAAAWNAMMGIARAGLSANAQYEALQEYLDVANLADYMIVNFYVGNDDWPRHNWYVSRRRTPGSSFRTFSWDAEHVIKDVAINQTGVADANSVAELYSRLRQNAEFRLLFADRVNRHFAPGGPLFVDPANTAWDQDHPERNMPAAIYMKRILEIDPAIVCESARWGDVRRPGDAYTRDDEWATELNWLLTQYFPRRTGIVLSQLRAAGLFAPTPAPIFSSRGGAIEPGFLLTITRPDGEDGAIQYTINGSDPRVYGTGAVDPSARVYGGPLRLDDRTEVKARILGASGWSALTDATFTVNAPFEALRITEIMYNPVGGRDFEFLELLNTGSATLELGGVSFSNGIDFAFPASTPMSPGQLILLAANAEAFSSRYPGVALGGVYDGSLDNSGEKITMKDGHNATILSVDYDDEPPWPLGPDGFGFSLVAVDATGDPDDPLSWRASAAPGGSPGEDDPLPGPGGVVISEVLTRARAPLEEAIELENTGAKDIDIGGWYLSDSRDDVTSLFKYRIPAGTVLPHGGRAVFYEYQFHREPGVFPSFALDDAKGAVYLAAASQGSLTGYITGVEFDGAEAGISFGRFPTSAGVDFTALTARTFGADAPGNVEEFRAGAGAPNAPPRVGPLVINEIRYNPPPGEPEFIELFNFTDKPVALYDAGAGRGWRIHGVLNVEGTDDFELSQGDSVRAKGFAVLSSVDPATFRSLHAVPPEVLVVGPWGGALDNGGERLTLFKPEGIDGGGLAFAVVDRVRYNNKAPWPVLPDGEDSSLERKRAREYGNEPANWDKAPAGGGTPGRKNSVSPPDTGNQPPLAFFSANPASGEEPLTVLLDASGSVDPDGAIAGYDWNFGDGFSGVGKAVTHVFSAGERRVTLTVRDGEGAEDTAEKILHVEPHVDFLIRPGDANEDGRLDLSDGIALLGHLFLGSPSALPCGDGTVLDPSNKTLLSANGDDEVNLSDAIYVLNYLFLGGPAPVAGTKCVAIPGCPLVCLQ
jgi:hypothetical protein